MSDLIAIARFALLPLVLVLTLGTFLVGGAWLWLGGGLLLVLNVVLDEVGGDYRSPVRRPQRWFLDGMVYSTVPLTGLLTLATLTTTASVGSPLWNVANTIGLETHGLLTVGGLGAVFSLGIVGGWTTGSTAHELMHRTTRVEWALSQFLLARALYCPSAIEHVFGHHRNVGLANDAATAPRNMTLWRYLPRALTGSHIGAARIEAHRLRTRGKPWLHPRNRFLQGIVLEIALLALVSVLAGFSGPVALAISAAISILVVESANYIGHYGLVRLPGTPVRPAHSWNAPRLLSTSAMVNLPRHSHHHRSATTRYWELTVLEDAPVLPYGVGMMAAAAFVPPLFFRLVGPLLEDWDDRLATDAEREAVGKPPRLHGRAT